MIPRPHAVLIDGTAYLYRAYFSLRSLMGRDGSQVNAVYGLMRTLLDLLAERQPEYAAIAFDDLSAPTFREAPFPAYKRTRPEMPERLVPQLDLAMELSRALGILPVRVPGFEADDILATLVGHLRTRGIACLVVAADKDLAQLVGPGIWLYPFGQRAPMDAAAVRERYGVSPERIPDLLALRGDLADNIPGIPGIGDRTALRLLANPAPVSALWEGSRALEGLGLSDAPAVAEALRQGRETFAMSRKLATLREDVPVDLPEQALVYRGVNTEATRSLCDRLGFDRLRDRIVAFAAEGSSAI